MLKILGALLYLVLLPFCVVAQQASTLNGSWMASYLTVDSGERVAEVILANSGGSWRDLRKGSQGKKNGCLEKEFSLSVSGEQSTQIKITVNSSTLLQGCADRHVILKVIDSKTLEGSFADGRSVKLVRQ